MLKDMKELANIYEKHSLNDLENQYNVTQKFVLEGHKMIHSKQKKFIQHSRIIAGDEKAKENIAQASKEQSEYIIKKHHSGEYADYLRKMYEKGIRTVPSKEEIPIA